MLEQETRTNTTDARHDNRRSTKVPNARAGENRGGAHGHAENKAQPIQRSSDADDTINIVRTRFLLIV